jgi:tetratricopeptide (TPR) repeat protein
MSLPVTVTFILADWIIKGLADGTLERIGGVIRKVDSKQVVGWLRDIAPQATSLTTNPVTGVLNLFASGANVVISTKGFSDVNKKLGGIEKQLVEIGQTLLLSKGVLAVATVTSMLTLGVCVIGFAVIAERLYALEEKLKKTEEILNKIDRKIDLSFYANFRAALDLASNAFTMTNLDNRRSSALQAINRFLEAEHIYTGYTDIELNHKSQIISEYLLTLSFAYIAEARCYLELEEHDTAIRRFQEGSKVIHSRIQKYVDILLTSNPAVYLQPQLKNEIDLRRLTRIYQWTDPDLDENAVFEMQRENIFKLAENNDEWLAKLPSAIIERSEIPWSLFGGNPTPFTGRFEKEAYKRLPQALATIESMIETNHRFNSYLTEIQLISQLGISFHEWLQLNPSTEVKPEGAELMYVIPFSPTDLQVV